MRILVLSVVALLCDASFAQDTCAVSFSGTPLTCPGDADATLTVQGTGGPFTYDWSHNALLTTATATGLTVGGYSVTVADTLGCIAVLDTVIEDPIVPPLGVMTTTNISCPGAADGSVSFAVNPGPYTWQWVDDPQLTSTLRTDLGPGGYTVLVSGGICPSYVTGYLGDPFVDIAGPVDYCPSAPPQLTAYPQWGFVA
ncbi:MAG: SprB repeat-containing protein, partial [Flavobacteriales bacterium]|nr:SprB repeat-containing protein [Flavobacteriales bacterium]